MVHEEYFDGMDMEQFKHIEHISSYNNNYYDGLNGDILFGLSDDDTETEWFLLKDLKYIYLGVTFIDDEKLQRLEKRQ